MGSSPIPNEERHQLERMIRGQLELEEHDEVLLKGLLAQGQELGICPKLLKQAQGQKEWHRAKDLLIAALDRLRLNGTKIINFGDWDQQRPPIPRATPGEAAQFLPQHLEIAGCTNIGVNLLVLS